MDIIVAAALIAVGIVVAAVVYARVTGAGGRAGRTSALGRIRRQAAVVTAVATAERPSAPPPAGSNGGGRAHSEELRRREHELELLEAQITERSSLLDHQQEELVLELERISGLSATRAKQMLIETVEDQARQEAARRVRQIEDDTRREADRRVRNILSVVMQRLAAGHATETTVSVVQLTLRRHEGPDHRT